jgi:alginate O-acetyltransferase complex protein AlgI
VIWSIVFFPMQIYCDFSGYSDIALGASRVMGIELMTNFNRPFAAVRLSDYWRRWHISLTTWFTDYLFKPLTIHFRDYGIWAIVLSITLTFLISGLWHGANWTYVLWGLLHGLGLSVETLSKKPLKNIKKSLGNFIYDNITRVITLAFVALTFVFFRAHSISDAFYLLGSTIHIDRGVMFGIPIFTSSFNLSCLLLMGIVVLIEYLMTRVQLRGWYDTLNRYLATDVAFCLLLLISIYLFGVFEEQTFIYFQF